MSLTRRRFLATSAAAALASSLRTGRAEEDETPDPLLAAMPRRPLGKTGAHVSLLALGGHPLGQLDDDDLAVRIVRRALELGVTYFDTAPSYARHRSERRIGKALGGRRDEVLIATKSYAMPAAKALEELEESLDALGTDRVDVFQIHAVTNAEDRKRKLDPEAGVLAAALQAKRQGKVRFIGVTGHADPEVMADCLEVHDFDTLLVPVNCADPLHRSFVEHTLPRAKAKGVGVVAMKVFAAGRLVEGDAPRATAAECLRYALSQDVATATAGFDSLAQLEADVRAVKAFRPMPADAQAALTERQAPHPGRSLEWYKRAD